MTGPKTYVDLKGIVQSFDARDADPLYVEEEQLYGWSPRCRWHYESGLEDGRRYQLAALILAGISGFLMGAALMWILR